MKLFRRFLYLSVVGAAVLTSCAEQVAESYDKYEDLSLKAWITQHRPDLIGNLQQQGGYYIDVISAGDMTTKPLKESNDSWISYDFSGRDLSGNIILTRRAAEAYQVGTFTKKTHYVPYYRYCGTQNSAMIEGSYLAVRNTLTLAPEYAKKKGYPEQLELRNGAEVVLYMPSRVASSISGSGGYEGQYTLDSRHPLIAAMIVRDTIKNPLRREGGLVDEFSKDNGGLLIYDKDKNKRPIDPKDPKHPYNAPERWVSAHDTIPQLYMNVRFDPKTDRLKFAKPYFPGAGSQFYPYNNETDMTELETKISEALVKRFHTKTVYEGVATLKADSVKRTGTATIWYIGRFLDGFIFDTNIDEVKKIIYDKVESAGTALSYTPESGSLIKAFYHIVPNLKFGQWASLITTSTHAYGSSGKAASTSSGSSSSSYVDYSNYLNYANSYYGSGGYYGGYYGNYYGGYNGGYYDPYYGSSYNSSTAGSTVTTTISTEIPSFTPLIFEFYIEPKK